MTSQSGPEQLADAQNEGAGGMRPEVGAADAEADVSRSGAGGTSSSAVDRAAGGPDLAGRPGGDDDTPAVGAADADEDARSSGAG